MKINPRHLMAYILFVLEILLVIALLSYVFIFMK